MDFLFYVPFFCTAAAVTDICFVNVEFFERKKLKVKRASHFVKLIVACPHRLPKLPESTQRKQAIPNKGSLFYSHCGSGADQNGELEHGFINTDLLDKRLCT
jgi:hypothetical protein